MGRRPSGSRSSSVTTGRGTTPSATCPPRPVAFRPCGFGTGALAVEQGYQQMKEELGLDHFEGRSWHGFHRHATLVMLAYGFLTLERLRAQAALAADSRAQKKRSAARGGNPRAAADLASGAPGASAAAAATLPPAVPVLPNSRCNRYLTE